MTIERRRVDVLGVAFDAVAFTEVLQAIRTAVINRTVLRVVPGNVDFVVKARGDSQLAADLADSDLVVADGVPILWAARLLGTPLKGRVSGTDLVARCAAISAETGATVALVGGDPQTTRRAAEVLMSGHRGADVRAIDTPFPLGVDESRQLVESIRESEARILCVALGAPRQERWLAEHLESSGAFVGIGCGSALDIISGDRPRAPRWMRDHGFEWLHRLLLEPRRLGRRYLIDDMKFFWYLLLGVSRQHRLCK